MRQLLFVLLVFVVFRAESASDAEQENIRSYAQEIKRLKALVQSDMASHSNQVSGDPDPFQYQYLVDDLAVIEAALIRFTVEAKRIPRNVEPLHACYEASC